MYEFRTKFKNQVTFNFNFNCKKKSRENTRDDIIKVTKRELNKKKKKLIAKTVSTEKHHFNIFIYINGIFLSR